MTTAYTEIGYIEQIIGQVMLIRGLPSVHIREVILIANNARALVLSMDDLYVCALLLDDFEISIGQQVTRTEKRLSVPVSANLLGGVHDPLLNNFSPPSGTSLLEVDVEAPNISKRSKVKKPFFTGVPLVDLLIPLGCGQRQLILGDQKIGKTEFITQIITNQARNDSLCIYAGIGKKQQEIKYLENLIQSRGIAHNCIIVHSVATDSLGKIYITPFVAMAIAEYFRDKGRDVALIMDDLSSHAKYYREIALTVKKFPGRGSYPGDIFYTHARLLERAGNFSVDGKDVSITCLSVAETVESDISGYIQTNLMSITDGHIFFDKDMFEQGIRPSINHFLSVTRVGRQTQDKLRWGIGRELSSFYTLLRDTERFSHFGAELNEGLKATLSMGQKLSSFFNQPMGTVIPINVQIIVFCLVWVGATGPQDSLDPGNFLFLVSERYSSNKELAKEIDKIIAESDDFNSLLGKVSMQSKQLMERINLA